MRKSLRLSIIILVLGLSLLLVTVMRTNSVPHTIGFDKEERSTTGWVMYSDFLLFSRDFKLDIKANNTVDVYVLDEVAAKQWNNSGTLDASWAFKNVKQDVFSEQSTSRGAYAVLVHLPADTATAVKITFTFSGFEQDLLAISVSVIVVGAIFVSISAFRARRSRNKLADQT